MEKALVARIDTMGHQTRHAMSKTLNTGTQNISKIAELAPKIWLVQDVELSKDFGSVNYQIHHTALTIACDQRNEIVT